MKKFFTSSSKNHDYQRETLSGGIGSGAASSHSGGSFIGKVFSLGQYHCTVEDIIAEGGFALVFLVKAQGNLGRFALKRLHVNNEQDLANCKREIDIAKKLGSHKNIIQLVESSINFCGNGVYEILMLMEYCKGQLLQLLNDRLKEAGGFAETEAIRILCDLCEAIARMHQSDPPIIHRDLKVENILVSENGHYQLCDFGSASTKVLSIELGQSAMSIEEEIKRYTTLSYRSPEMVDIYSGKPITTKADIWALGCLLYKICFFQLPFGESTLAIQNALLTIPDDKVDRYSSKLLSLIGYMLVADPEKRPDIYQVSALAFQLAEQSCPVVNIKAKVRVPAWSELPVPPTESSSREEKRKISSTNQPISSAAVIASTPQQVSGSHHFETPSTTTTTAVTGLDNRTTSVTPRQRPKASININSLLSTSPVTFQQRPATPNDINATTVVASSALNLPATKPSNLTSSASFGSNLASSAGGIEDDDDDDDIDWSKKKSHNKQKSPNPQTMNNEAECSFQSSIGSSSKNPFLDSSVIHSSSLPRPPSRRHSQTPPTVTLSPPPSNVRSCHDVADTTVVRETSSHAAVPPSFHHHHRRNMSDTSAFSLKNQQAAAAANFTIGSFTNSDTSLKSSPEVVSSQSRIRSLNPFEDPNDYSYEDQLFGHEFDRIRQENSSNNNNRQQQSVVVNKESEDGAQVTGTCDPFDSVPFNPDRVKRYFERQLSAGEQQCEQHSATSVIHGKPYNVNIVEQSKPTVISIRSNHQFTIHNGTGESSSGGGARQVVSASSSSAFAPPPPQPSSSTTTTTNNTSSSSALEESMSKLTVSMPTTNQSISSSSQGQTALTASNYMPLYSSDTAEDSDDDSSSQSSDLNENSHNEDDHHHALHHYDESEDVIDEAHLQMSADLIKPLVAHIDDDEDDDDGGGGAFDDHNNDDEDDEADASSIGSASDLQHTSDTESDSSDSDVDIHHHHHHHHNHHHHSPSSGSDSERSELSSEDESCNHRRHSHSRRKSDDFPDSEDLDGGFEFVNYDGTNYVRRSDRSKYCPTSTTTLPSSSSLSSNIVVPDIGVRKNISCIQINSTSANKQEDEGDKSSQQDGDGTSVGEVLSNASSIISSTKNNDNTNVSIDHLIGHIEGHRPLLEEEDDAEDLETTVTIDPNHVKPFIEMDHELEFVPVPVPVANNNNNNTLLDNNNTESIVDIMFSSMTSSVNSVIMQSSLTEPSLSAVPGVTYHRSNPFPANEIASASATVPVTVPVPDFSNSATTASSSNYSDNFETISLQQICDESEENRRLDEEVAQSLNRQVIRDQLVNKDLFGSIPFTDKELINQSIIQQENQSKLKSSKEQFESSFTEMVVPVTATATAIPVLTTTTTVPGGTEASLLPVVPSVPKLQIKTTAGPKSSTDLFGAVPFDSGSVKQTTSTTVPLKISTSTAKSETKSNNQHALEIITLKPVNYQPPPSIKAIASSGVPPLNDASTTTATLFSHKPVSSTTSSTTTTIASTTMIVNVTPKTVISSSTKASSGHSQVIQPVAIVSHKVVTSSKIPLQKTNSKLKSKVAKKYEVDESDDEVDGLLDADPNVDEEVLLGDGGELVVQEEKKKSSSKKKDKKKDKKEKPDKKSKEKEMNKEKIKEEKKSKKEKAKTEKESKKESKSKETTKNKEQKEKEKLERKSEKEKKSKSKSKESADSQQQSSKTNESKNSSSGSGGKTKEENFIVGTSCTTTTTTSSTLPTLVSTTIVGGLLSSTPLKKHHQTTNKQTSSSSSSSAVIIESNNSEQQQSRHLKLSKSSDDSIIKIKTSGGGGGGSKLKLPKHHAFANMSFEDENHLVSHHHHHHRSLNDTTIENTSTTTGGGGGGGGGGSRTLKNNANTSNVVTITRC